MPRIGDLVEERVGLIGENRSVLDKAEEETRDLSAEERQEYDRRDARIEELTGDIKRHQDLQRHSELDLRAVSGEEEDKPAGEPENRQVKRDSEEYRDALTAYARGADLNAEQRSTLNVGEAKDGGYAVPEEWGSLVQSLREGGIIRQLATVVTTEAGTDFHVPYVKADATAPGIVAEQEEIPDDGEEFDEKVIQAYKIARMTKASEEMVTDALFDVAAFVGSRLGFDIGRAANGKYVKGTGESEPEGLFAKATVGKELASKAAITFDEVIDLEHSIIRPYRGNAAYIGADSTIAALRKIKDEMGQYLWQPSLQIGEPDTLNGKAIYSDPDVDALGSEKVVLGFGDVKRSYLIRDVTGVVLRLLTERYADKGQVAWRGVLRTGAAIVDANAFKTAKCPA